MKTFEEACAMFYGPEQSPMQLATGNLSKEATEHVARIQERYQDLIVQIAHDPAVKSLVSSLILQAVGGVCTVDDVFMTAFAYGVLVGIEMEKQECSELS